MCTVAELVAFWFSFQAMLARTHFFRIFQHVTPLMFLNAKKTTESIPANHMLGCAAWQNEDFFVVLVSVAAGTTNPVTDAFMLVFSRHGCTFDEPASKSF